MTQIIIERAYNEWKRYTTHARLESLPPLNLRLGEGESMGVKPDTDGYYIDANENTLTIYAVCAEGLLYGVFSLIRLCSIAGNRFSQVKLLENPAFKTRLLWSWSRLMKGYRHAPYLNFRSLINPNTMARPEKYPEMMRFIRNMAQMGVNALAITHELHHIEVGDYDQHGFRPYYPAIQVFSEYLRSWGIKLYLYTASAPEMEFKRKVADTNCSFDPRVQHYYVDFIEEINRELPFVEGLLIAGGLGGYAGGSLYDCTCEHCSGKPPLERIKKQIQVLSDALNVHGKKLVYTLTTDLPFTMDKEVDAVLGLLDSIPENTILSFKTCYHDFEELRYPEHPLFGRLAEQPGQNKEKRLAVEYQLFPEMRGKGIILSNITEVYAKMFRDSNELGMNAAIAVIETHPDDAHPSMADWYAWGRLCWNPNTSGKDLLMQWVSLRYPHEAAAILAELLEKSFEAAGKLLYSKGVQNGSHGMIISQPYFVRDILNDTWFPGAQKQPDGVIGSNERQVWLYTEERRKQIKNDTELELFNQTRKVDAALITGLMEEKAQACTLFKDMYEMLSETEKFFPQDDYRYNALMTMLRRNVADAQRIYAYFDTFLRWQGGILTEDDIRKVRSKYIGTGQECSVYSCDDLFELFLSRLEKALRGESFDRYFESVYSLPQYDGTEKIWQVGAL